MNNLLTPASASETVVQVLSGPKWDGKRWVWTFFAYWLNLAPAFCGKCGRCTNPNNVPPCGHMEAQRHVQGQIFVTNLGQFEKDCLERGRTVRFTRDGRNIGSAEAEAVKA